MRLGPFEITRRKAQQDLVTRLPDLLPSANRGWWPILREGFAGAWQRGIVTPVEDAMTYPTFWACVTLIAGDIAKMRPRLMQEADGDIETETTSPAYSPVLTRPNHYQNRIQFYTYWLISKLTRGNAYALKVRDNRNVVTDLYLLDPTRVRPMVAPSGDVYYQCGQDVLSGVDESKVMVPAREMIHDRMNAIYHPLVGLSAVYACGHAALQGLQIMRNTTRFAENGSLLGGLLVAPGQISETTAKRLEEHWNSNYAGAANAGKIAAIGDGLKFEKPNIMSAVDAQIIEQLKWSDEKVCSAFHVPAYMVGVGSPPNFNNIAALNQQYYSQCLQTLIEELELCLAEGLELASGYEIEFDVEALLRMDPVQLMEVVTKGVVGGVLSPNEGRRKFNLPPVTGGETPYLQQQNYSLTALAERDAAPSPAPAPAPPIPPTKALDGGELLLVIMREYERITEAA